MGIETATHQSSRCLECRVNDLEDWLSALSSTVAWAVLFTALYLAWRGGVFGDLVVRHA